MIRNRAIFTLLLLIPTLYGLAITSTFKDVEPFVNTRWGQLTPFNQLCPEVNGNRTATGCVATAMAQALSVYNKPDVAIGTISYTTATHNIFLSENLENYPFMWNEMLDSYGSGYNDTQAKAVANLMYACGLSLKMDYSTESGTPTSNLLGASIDRFGYDQDMIFANLDAMQIEDWHRMLIENLDKGIPVIYSAQNEFDEGHCFIIDGYSMTDTEPFYHVNWGWGGRCNGNYRIHDLSPAEPGTGGGSGNFNLNNSAILGFKPEDGIKENGGFMQASSISLSPKIIGPGITSATVEFKSLYNYGARTFSGDIQIYLADKDGTDEVLLDTHRLNNVLFMSGSGRLERRIVLPPTLTSGEYILKVYVQADGMERQSLCSGSIDAELVILPNREEYKPDLLITDLFLDAQGGRNVSVDVLQLLNADEIPFSGSLSLAVADMDGNILTNFGNDLHINNLLTNKAMEDVLTLKGTIPSGISDGKYQICLLAQQDNYEGWSSVTGYSMQDGEMVLDHTPQYCVIVIENGEVSVSEEDLPEYYPHLEATALEIIQNDEIRNNVTLTLSGLRNFADADFFGTLSLALCDEDANILTLFGKTEEIESSMPSGTTLVSSLSFTGTIPKPISDGKYSLRIAANQKYCKGWALVDKYIKVVTNITEQGLPLMVEFWIIDGTLSFDAPIVPVESITLNKDQLYLREGKTQRLIATVLPEDATNTNVIWASTNPSVATVNNEGYVTAVSVGEAIISATAEDGSGVFATCEVTVQPVLAESITLNYSSYNLDPGKSVQLIATIMPRNTTNKTVTWESRNPSIASVDNNGLVTCVGEGSTEIIATTTDGSNLSASCMIGSHNYLVEAIYINPSEATLQAGKSLRLTVLVLPEDAANKVVEWSSSNPSIVSVNNSGVATAHTDGKAIVYATATDGSGVSGACFFNCTDGIVTITFEESIRIYSPDGKPLTTPRKGLNIIVDSSGIAHKVFY